MPDDPLAHDQTYALLLELERLEELREELAEGDAGAREDLRALGLTSPAALSDRIAALHRQLDALA